MEKQHLGHHDLSALFLALIAVCVITALVPMDIEAREMRTIRIIGTSDMHGQMENWDYFADTPLTGSGRGMAKICTYVKQARAENPDTIVLDNGDTIQGTPLNYLYNVLRKNAHNPMAMAMNIIGYDSMTPGNHEFNFGIGTLNRFVSEAEFPVIAANVRKSTDGSRMFAPYVMKNLSGVGIGIIGLTTPAIPHWERAENIAGLRFTDPVEEAKACVQELKSQGADVIVITAHTGTNPDFGYGHEENFARDLAESVSGVDVVLAGHAHAAVNEDVKDVLIMEPRNAGISLCDIQIELAGSGSDWEISSKAGEVRSMSDVPEDPSFLALMMPYQEATRKYVNSPIGAATGEFPGGFAARIHDGPTADLINLAQTEAAAEAGYPVDASCAALFSDRAMLPAGTIRLKDAYSLYQYDNTLFVVEATGAIVKDVLEWNAQYFDTYDGVAPLPTRNQSFPDYNYDMWSGIEYRIDITKPVGERVTELRLNGMPVSEDQKIMVAVNNYRATSQFIPRGARALYSSTTEVRDLMVEYISEHSPLKPEECFIKNWELYPEFSQSELQTLA